MIFTEWISEIQKYEREELSKLDINLLVKGMLGDEVDYNCTILLSELITSPLLGIDVEKKDNTYVMTFSKNNQKNTNAIKTIVKYRLLNSISSYICRSNKTVEILDFIKKK